MAQTAVDGTAGGNGGTPAGDSGAAKSDGNIFDPASITATGSPDGSNGTGEPKRKRGRPPGSRNRNSAGTGSAKKQAKGSPVHLEGIEKILLSIHVGMAAFLKAPELMISQDEAKTLSSAIAEVSEHYPVVADAKTLAWINLTMALGMIYGPRGVAIYVRNKGEKNGGGIEHPPA